MMPSAPTLRTLERVFVLPAWGAFGLGAAAVLGLCGLALLAEPPTPPEQFLVRLAVILAASLVPMALFRGIAGMCRRRRARLQARPATLVRSLSMFEDSTLGQ